MDYNAYKLLHVVGLLLLFIALGGLAVLGALGTDPARSKPIRAVLSAFHGLGLVILVVAGFGLLARLNISAPAQWGGWVYAKLLLWVIFGAAVVPLKRAPTLARLWLVVLAVLGCVAGWLALMKPF
jgi:hypothetical protein